MESLHNRNLLDRVQLAVVQKDEYETLRPLTKEENDGHRGNMLRAVRAFTRGGAKMLSSEQQQEFIPELSEGDVSQNPLLAKGDYFAIRTSDAPGRRPYGVTRSDIDTGAGAAGEAVIETWDSRVIESLSFLGGVANAAAEITTETGGERHYNQMDSGTEEGELLTDQAGTSISMQDLPVIPKVTMYAFVLHSKMMSIRLEAEQDVHFSLEERAMREAARRIGRGWNRQFTLGTGGNGAPQGIVPVSRVRDGLAGSLNAITYKNLLGLEEDIDEAYLMGSEMAPGGFSDVFSDGYVGYMMHRSAEFIMRQQLDADNRPLWISNHDIGQAIQGSPGILNTYPYFLNQHMQPMGVNNNKPMVFGNLGHYLIRNIPEFGIFKFWDSNTAQTLSTWYLAVTRRDGRLIGPTTANLADALIALQLKT